MSTTKTPGLNPPGSFHLWWQVSIASERKHTCARSVHDGFERSQVFRVCREHQLGMPLQADDEAAFALLDRFNQTIVGTGADNKSIRNIFDCLMVERIDSG